MEREDRVGGRKPDSEINNRQAGLLWGGSQSWEQKLSGLCQAECGCPGKGENRLNEFRCGLGSGQCW